MGHNTPIIALTASVMPKDKEQYMAGGISDCLCKPFKRQDLWICLLKYLEPAGQKPVDVLNERRKNREVIDRELGIENCAGNEIFYEQTLIGFLKSGRDTYIRLEKAITEQNYPLAYEIAHKEGGLASVIGAVKLAKLLSDLIKGLKAGSPGCMKKMLTSYDAELRNVLNYIEAK